ncbi:glycine cleavage system protein R [Aestuariibacter sp. A3R04]|uniref:glycine cleavage system protein R n=1 Tax=Aestuariibacter sp. A3R04 TaxID=2841571 RepID=UPI001C08A446|nr:ACT domain-containing protein [Aestuariibacter sp. A3R04]MBU3020886.1 glycine cleavage system protein R [Aestuariibacter sp. A3R04]
MQSLIITIMGKDKPGLVDALAKCVYRHDANWLGSSFAHMAGHFTGFVEVHVPSEKHDELVAALNSLPDLTVQSVSIAEKTAPLHDTLAVEVMGNDKPGIVQELTHILNQFNLNIVSFDSRCESAPNWGSLMFKAKAVIAVSENFDDSALQTALEGIANDLVVDINTNQED